MASPGAAPICLNRWSAIPRRHVAIRACRCASPTLPRQSCWTARRTGQPSSQARRCNWRRPTASGRLKGTCAACWATSCGGRTPMKRRRWRNMNRGWRSRANTPWRPWKPSAWMACDASVQGAAAAWNNRPPATTETAPHLPDAWHHLGHDRLVQRLYDLGWPRGGSEMAIRDRLREVEAAIRVVLFLHLDEGGQGLAPIGDCVVLATHRLAWIVLIDVLIPRRLHVSAPLIHVVDRALPPSALIARFVHMTPERVEAEIEGDLAMNEGAGLK